MIETEFAVFEQVNGTDQASTIHSRPAIIGPQTVAGMNSFHIRRLSRLRQQQPSA